MSSLGDVAMILSTREAFCKGASRVWRAFKAAECSALRYCSPFVVGLVIASVYAILYMRLVKPQSRPLVECKFLQWLPLLKRLVRNVCDAPHE